MRYAFSDCIFNADSFELTRNGTVVETTPQVLSILQFLLVGRSRLITKDELVEEVWNGRAISDAAISVRIRALRKAIGDTGSGQALLKTIRGRGFRFIGKVTVESDTILASAEETFTTDDAVKLRSQPSVAVLAAHIVGDPGPYDFLAEALPDEMLTALSRMRSLFVTARGSSFQHQSYEDSPRAVGEALRCAYVVSTEIEIKAGKLRIACELADAKDDSTVWRDTHLIDLEEIHEMRDEIVRNIAARIDQNITHSELQRARLRVPSDLNIWQNFHVGTSKFEQQGVPDFDNANIYFQRAVDADPNFARAYAGLAQTNLSRFFWQWSPGMEGYAKTGIAAANTAYQLDPLDPICALVDARRHFFIGDHQMGESKLRHAITLSPSNYWAHVDMARVLIHKGHAEDAMKHLELSTALHPAWLSPLYNLETRSLLALWNRDIDEAVATVRKIEGHNCPRVHSTMAAITAYHMAGLHEDADRAAKLFEDRFAWVVQDQVGARNFRMRLELAEPISEAFVAHGLDRPDWLLPLRH